MEQMYMAKYTKWNLKPVNNFSRFEFQIFIFYTLLHFSLSFLGGPFIHASSLLITPYTHTHTYSLYEFNYKLDSWMVLTRAFSNL